MGIIGNSIFIVVVTVVLVWLACMQNMGKRKY